MRKLKEVKLEDKYLLTIPEASQYFGIGKEKIKSIVNDNLIGGDFFLQNGTRILIKRQKFEEWLDKTDTI